LSREKMSRETFLLRATAPLDDCSSLRGTVGNGVRTVGHKKKKKKKTIEEEEEEQEEKLTDERLEEVALMFDFEIGVTDHQSLSEADIINPVIFYRFCAK